MPTNQPHNINISITTTTNVRGEEVEHQITSVSEGASDPKEFVWKAMYLGKAIEKAFDDMAKMAMAGDKPPWER